MRLSSLIRGVENIVITVGGKLAVAAKEFAHDVSKETDVRLAYKAETSAARRARLEELRTIIDAQELAAARKPVTKSRKPVTKSRKRRA